MMLYEEDLMASIAAMTGSSLEAADDMRAAIVRADNAATLADLERDFVAASVQNGVTASEALAVWLVLARFAAYSFNKAHAASYAELAWQSAYLKTHYPVEFAAAVLNSYGGHYPLRTVAGDLARCGVRLLGPHVNFSETACTAEAGAVRVGLSAVKRLTAKSRRGILDRGTFNTLADLLARVMISHRERRWYSAVPVMPSRRWPKSFIHSHTKTCWNGCARSALQACSEGSCPDERMGYAQRSIGHWSGSKTS
jgi:DNA polymerase-3 subunit alpha